MIDLEDLQRRLGGDRAAAETVLSAFVREAPKMIGDLSAAVANDDRALIQRLAHTVRGTLLWIGATDAASSARKVEVGLSSGPENGSQSALLTLCGQVQEIVLGLRSRASRLAD